MGINDAAEMLEVAKEECGRLERALKAEKDEREKDFVWMLAKVTGMRIELDAAHVSLAAVATIATQTTWTSETIRAIRAALTPEQPSKPLAAQLAPPTRTSATEAQREDRG